MLIGNGRLTDKIPLTLLGRDWNSQLQAGSLPACTSSDNFGSKQALPNGYYTPHGWMLPRKGGTLRAGLVSASGGVSAGTMQSGRNIDATVIGSGGVDSTQTFLGLIVSLVASITGSGTVSTAVISAITNLLATITGSGSVTATAAGLADLQAALLGEGAITPNNTALMDIAASIVSYGSLTPEGIRDTVWTAILANYPGTGSAGLALATASSGGVDYTALGNAVWVSASRTLTANPGATTAEIVTALLTAAVDGTTTLEESIRLHNAVLAGKVSGAGSGTETFRDLADTKDRIVATVDSSGNRSAIIRDAT